MAVPREGFDAFYAAHRFRLIRELSPIVGHQAEDVAQESLFELWRRWDIVSRYDSPTAWVRRIAIRAAIRQRTRDIARPRLEALATVNDPRPDGVTETSPMLETALRPLSREDREALVLHHLLDRPVGEVAERLGVSEGAARVRLSRARNRLGESLSGLRGTWVMQRTWQRTALAGELVDHGYGAHVGTVMDDLQECGPIRTHLRFVDGRFLLTNNENDHLDHGSFRFEHGRLRMKSDGYSGFVVHRAAMDGNVLQLIQVENRNPLVKGVPDDAFQFALLGSTALRWEPAAANLR